MTSLWLDTAGRGDARRVAELPIRPMPGHLDVPANRRKHRGVAFPQGTSGTGVDDGRRIARAMCRGGG